MDMGPVPGWYPDPVDPGTVRWFDGERWTELVEAGPGAAAPAAATAPTAVTGPGGPDLPPGPPAPGARRVPWLLVAAAGSVVLVVAALCVVLVVGRSTPASAAVRLVALDARSPTGFTPSTVTVDPGVTGDLRSAPTAVATPPADGPGLRLVATAADTPGLYGSVPSGAPCDRDALRRGLPGGASGRRWDRLVGGARSDRSVAIASLTPLLLVRDTVVTVHTPRGGTVPAVLQSGTAVLVDTSGVPRVRCATGAPLSPPAALGTRVRLTGRAWDGFDPAAVVLVTATPSPLAEVRTVDTATGQLVTSPLGGTEPAPPPAQPTPTPLPAPAPTGGEQPVPAPPAPAPAPSGPDRAIRAVDVRNATLPADSCNVDGWASSPPIALVDGSGTAGDIDTAVDASGYAEVFEAQVVGYADLDGDGTEDAVTTIGCTAGGTYGDMVVLPLTVGPGGPGLVGGRNLAAVATDPGMLDLSSSGEPRLSRIFSARLEGTEVVVDEEYDATGEECNACLSGRATVRWRWDGSGWTARLG